MPVANARMGLVACHAACTAGVNFSGLDTIGWQYFVLEVEARHVPARLTAPSALRDGLTPTHRVTRGRASLNSDETTCYSRAGCVLLMGSAELQ